MTTTCSIELFDQRALFMKIVQNVVPYSIASMTV
jgi:hypothetical protein